MIEVAIIATVVAGLVLSGFLTWRKWKALRLIRPDNLSSTKSIANGGEGGIRTPDELTPMPHFECGAFDHSATSPDRVVAPEGAADT